jgi:predicted dehydrogenase
VEILRRGLLGPVREVHGWTTRPHWPQGIDRPGDAPPVPAGLNWEHWLGAAAERAYHPAYHPAKWRGWRDFGTGGLGDFGNDLFDAVCDGLAFGMPTKVSAETSELRSESFPAQSTITFDFAAQGKRPPLKLVYYDGGRRPPEAATGGVRLPADGTLIVGEEARLFLSPFDGPPRILGPRPREIAIPPDPLPDSPSHQAAFIAAIRGDDKPASDFARAAERTKLLLLGVVSQQLGRPLTWNAAQSSFDDREADKLLSGHYRPGWELPR